MSHSSRRRGAEQVFRDAAQFGEAFRRQYRLLVTLGQAFDEGNEDVAYSLTGPLRVLLDHRLLDRVLKMKSLRLLDTARRPESIVPGRGYAGYGLASMGVVAGTPGGRFWPNKDAQREGEEMGRTVFKDWWSRDLSIFAGGSSFTREYVTLEMANTDALHVDASRDADYLKLFDENRMLVYEGEQVRNSLAGASVRQIAWELQTTLELDHPALLEN